MPKRQHNGEHLLVVYLVVALGGVEALAEEGDGAGSAVDDLVEDGTGGVVRGIGLEAERDPVSGQEECDVSTDRFL